MHAKAGLAARVRQLLSRFSPRDPPAQWPAGKAHHMWRPAQPHTPRRHQRGHAAGHQPPAAARHGVTRLVTGDCTARSLAHLRAPMWRAQQWMRAGGHSLVHQLSTFGQGLPTRTFGLRPVEAAGAQLASVDVFLACHLLLLHFTSRPIMLSTQLAMHTPVTRCWASLRNPHFAMRAAGCMCNPAGMCMHTQLCGERSLSASLCTTAEHSM